MIPWCRPRFRRAAVLAAGVLLTLVGTTPVTAAPAAGAAAPTVADPVIVGAGDIAACADPSGAEATAALLGAIPGTVFALGDDAYVNGTPAEFADCYDPTWGRFKARTTLPVAGNHDYNTPGAAGYFGYFGAAAGDPAKGYYDTTIGSWHVIVLNSNCEAVGGCGAGSLQETWLRSVLAASTAPCTVALWHEPAFSSATIHRAFPLYLPFWQALYDYGADVVLNASDHVYERFAPQTPDGDADPTFGLRQFTVGTGGRSHQAFKAPEPNSEVRNGSTYGVLALTLHAGSYDWRFAPVAGQKFTDSGSGTCHGAPPPPSADPGPVTWVGSSSGGSKTPLAALPLGRPAGTTPGDVMVASIVSGQTKTGFAAPPGWTVVQDSTISGKLRQTIYERVAGPSEPASYTWKPAKPGQIAGGITTYAGVDTAHPVLAHAATVTKAAGTAITAPSVKTTVPGARIVDFAAVNAEGTVVPANGTTMRFVAASPTGGTTDALVASSDRTQAKAGATAKATSTATEPGGRIAAVLALRPAPPAPGP